MGRAPHTPHRGFGLAVLAGALALGGLAAAQTRAVQGQETAYATSWDEYQALKARAHGGTRMTWAKLPDWTGVWTRAGGFAGLNFDPTQKGRRATAELTPDYAARYDRKLADLAKGVDRDPLADCLPAGHPRFLAEPYAREFIVRPEEVWWVQEEGNEVRRIYADGRAHLPDAEAGHEVEGDSIGFWDGDTLVVHTNHLRAGQYQKNQPDYSDQVSTVERLRKIDANTIENRISVYDPPSLAKPWRVTARYERVTDAGDFRLNYWSCVENNRAVQNADGTTTMRLGPNEGKSTP